LKLLCNEIEESSNGGNDLSEKRVDVKSEARTIMLYTLSIILSIATILSAVLVGASQTVLTFGSFIAAVSIVMMVVGINYARQRKETTTHFHDRSGAPTYSSTRNARTYGFMAGLWTLFLVMIVAYSSLEFLVTADIVPGLMLIASGIIALIGALTYKIR
jgi:hypothetical protein